MGEVYAALEAVYARTEVARTSQPNHLRRNRGRDAGDGCDSRSHHAAYGSLCGAALSGRPEFHAARLYIQSAAIHHPRRVNRGMAVAERGIAYSPKRVLAHDRDSCPAGIALDLLFAQWFFCYPNKGATLGLQAFAFGRPVPVEEYIFYLTGFLADLLLYVWLGEFWVAAYNVQDYPGEAKKMRRLLHFHPTSLVLAVVLIGAAWIYKRHFAAPADQAGFPGYFTVLVTAALLPAVTFYPVAKRFINWRALSLTIFFMALISLLWEATLALPYNWWNFQHRQMIGLFIGAWSGLPIEEVCVWIAVTYATVIIFEVMKVLIASERPVREALLGKGSSS
jgi:hypothetical protein